MPPTTAKVCSSRLCYPERKLHSDFVQFSRAESKFKSAMNSCAADGTTQVLSPKAISARQRYRLETRRISSAMTPPAPLKQSRLLYPCAAPLDQDYQHDNKKHTGYNPDNRGSVHFVSPFMKWLKN